jgi:hypothetical protein
MIYTNRAIEALKVVEATLRDIIGQALAAKAYRDLASVASAADAVTALISELSGSTPVKTLLGPSSAQESQSLRTSATANHQAMAARTANVVSRRMGYPRFLRDGDRLVKVAWSKKERKPYEHRAPQAIIQTLIDAVRKRKGEGKLFEAADVLPLVTGSGEEYPSYQSYLALAWLRHVGIVAKKGRDGYILKRDVGTPQKLDELWASLPVGD